MRLRELFEEESKHIAFCFGRLNPPTIGHKQLLDTVAGVGGDFKIFVSPTQDPKKNPLDYNTKIKFIKAIIPEYAGDIVEDPSLNTPVKIASYLYDQGYRHATFVAGSDRLADMQKLLQMYNGVEGKAHGYYKFETLDFKSSGEREDGAEGVAGISASGARAAAASGDFEAFVEATGAGKYAESLYNAVRKGMGINEGADHISPSGVKTNMDPTDDDYEINYGKNGLVAKDRKARGVDVKTGSKKVEEANYGRYWCSTDKKWKTRKGPKQKRSS